MTRTYVAMLIVLLIGGCDGKVSDSQLAALQERVDSQARIACCSYASKGFANVDGERVQIDTNAQVVELLSNNDIQTEVVLYQDFEWIVWSEEDNDKANKLLAEHGYR